MVDDRSETPIVSRGFVGRRRAGSASLPPGQYVTDDFPVLSAGPTPKIPLDEWEFTLTTESGAARKWSWKEFRALPSIPITTDIHCVTRWSKFATTWEGVSLDTLLEGLRRMFVCDGGFVRWIHDECAACGSARRQSVGRIPVRRQGPRTRAWWAGATARSAPVLWKSAKWLRGIRLMPKDRPGFWERLGYNKYGDPWREQRYWGD